MYVNSFQVVSNCEKSIIKRSTPASSMSMYVVYFWSLSVQEVTHLRDLGLEVLVNLSAREAAFLLPG